MKLCKICNKNATLRCTPCKTSYCSKECQKLDWTVHKNECVEFPVAYKDQYEKDVMWICDYDEEERITSVFVGNGEKYNAYMPNLMEVKNQEKLLKDAGWVKINRPKIEVTFDN